jgi:tRNA(fMet)-specific endonuclease VapC
MKYLVDTDVVANWLKGRRNAIQLLSALAPSGLAISLITYGELYEGLHYGRNPVANERIFRRFLRGVRVLPLNRAIMRRFARVRGQLRQSGQMISDSDILIGVTALHYDLTLVTGNTRHFQRIPGLALYSSSQ